MTGIEDQLRSELRREAERYRPSPDAWARLQHRGTRRTRQWLPPLVAAAVVLAAVTGTVLAVRGHHGSATAAGSVPDACLTRPANPILLTNPGFDTAATSGYLAGPAGAVFCVNHGNQFWGTPVGTGVLPAVGMTRMHSTIDNVGGPETLIAGLTAAGGSTVRLADADSHEAIGYPLRYAALGGRRIFICLAPRSYRHVAISLIGEDGTVLASRTVALQAAVIHD